MQRTVSTDPAVRFSGPGFLNRFGTTGRLLLIAALGLLFSQASLRAEDESGQLSFPDETPPLSDSMSSSSVVTRPHTRGDGPGSGIDGRIGFIGLPTLGRDDSIIPVELFPYIQTEDQILFGDLRGFLTTDGNLGANIGLGYRFIEPNDFVLFGVNAFYDVDNTWGKTFHQLSLGWEARTEWVGLFGNVYFPIGKKNQILSQSVFNERFEDNRILFDVRSRTGQAMSGLDLNVQALLPGDFARDHQILFTAGWYTFNGSGLEDINGVQLQLQGDVHPNVTLMASYTNDKTFGSNATVGGMFRFGTRDRPDVTLQGQLRRFINRNYNVIVSTKSVTETGIAAINRETGNEYVVQHVGSGSGTGTYDNPFDNVQDAQDAGADIIFVHEGTTLNESIVLQDGQSLIGEGSNVTFRDSRYGNFRLPGSSSGSVTTPVIDGTGIGGDLLTLANNSQVHGFHIQNSQGHGVVGNSISNFKISNVTIENSTDDALYLSDVTDGMISNVHIEGGTNGVTLIDIDGTMTLSDIFIDNVSGDGVHIDGGHGRIAFMRDLIIKDAGQSAFFVTNLETLVEVDDRGTVSTSDDITTETPGFVTVDGMVVRNTTGGTGIHLENNEGVIAFGAVDIETENASAFYVSDTENAQILNGFLKTENAPVADVENSGINVALTRINADGGATGLRFVETTGQFMVYGSGDLGTGGEIKNTTDAIYMENGPMVAFQTVNFTANNAIARIDGADALVLVGSNITQTAETFIHAKNLTMLQVMNSQFTNNTITSGTGILLETDKTGSFTSSVTYNKVDALPGTFLKVQTLAGGEGASLAFNFQGNEVALTSANSVAAAVNWTGPTTSYFLNNKITGSAANQTGIQFYTGASGDQAQVMISQNEIILGGTSSIGVDVDTRSTSTVHVVANGIMFNNTNGTGVRMNLRKASGANVSGNEIVDNSGGATGILFENIEHLSTLVVNANKIDVSHASAFVDRGIVLTNVLNADAVANPFVTFVSTESNTVLGATVPYSLPATGVTGTLLINGVSVE